MATQLDGIYRNGRIDLAAIPHEAEGSRVVVTWVGSAETVDLRERGVGLEQAADLRFRLSAFRDDWDQPEMAVYDELPQG